MGLQSCRFLTRMQTSSSTIRWTTLTLQTLWSNQIRLTPIGRKLTWSIPSTGRCTAGMRVSLFQQERGTVCYSEIPCLSSSPGAEYLGQPSIIQGGKEYLQETLLNWSSPMLTLVPASASEFNAYMQGAMAHLRCRCWGRHPQLALVNISDHPNVHRFQILMLDRTVLLPKTLITIIACLLKSLKQEQTMLLTSTWGHKIGNSLFVQISRNAGLALLWCWTLQLHQSSHLLPHVLYRACYFAGMAWSWTTRAHLQIRSANLRHLPMMLTWSLTIQAPGCSIAM